MNDQQLFSTLGETDQTFVNNCIGYLKQMSTDNLHIYLEGFSQMMTAVSKYMKIKQLFDDAFKSTFQLVPAFQFIPDTHLFSFPDFQEINDAYFKYVNTNLLYVLYILANFITNELIWRQ